MLKVLDGTSAPYGALSAAVAAAIERARCSTTHGSRRLSEVERDSVLRARQSAAARR